MTTRLFPLLAALLLAGCAHYQWRHADGAQNFDADSYQCKQEAAKAFPPEIRNVTVYPGHFVGPYWHCPPGGPSHGACWYNPGFWDWPQVEPYDISEKSRVDLYNSCLKARGWAYIRVD